MVTQIVVFYFPILQVEHTSMSSDFELGRVTWFDQRSVGRNDKAQF